MSGRNVVTRSNLGAGGATHVAENENDFTYGTEQRPDLALSGGSSKAEIGEFAGKVLAWHMLLVGAGFGIGLGACKALEKTKMLLLDEQNYEALKKADDNMSEYAFMGVYAVLGVLLMVSFVPKRVLRKPAVAILLSLVLAMAYAIMMIFCFIHYRTSFAKEYLQKESERIPEKDDDGKPTLTYAEFQQMRVSIDKHVFKGVVFYACVYMLSAISVAMAGVDFIRPSRVFFSAFLGFFFMYILCNDYPLSYVFNMAMGAFLILVPALVILGIQKFILIGKPKHSEWIAVAMISFFDIPRTVIGTFSAAASNNAVHQ